MLGILMAIGSILRPFGMLYSYLVYISVLVCRTKKNLAPLAGTFSADVLQYNKSIHE
jgi:hypothetical protein